MMTNQLSKMTDKFLSGDQTEYTANLFHRLNKKDLLYAMQEFCMSGESNPRFAIALIERYLTLDLISHIDHCQLGGESPEILNLILKALNVSPESQNAIWEMAKNGNVLDLEYHLNGGISSRDWKLMLSIFTDELRTDDDIDLPLADGDINENLIEDYISRICDMAKEHQFVGYQFIKSSEPSI